MATFTTVFDDHDTLTKRRRVDEGDSWLPLHTIKSAISHLVPARPGKLLLRAAPRQWVSSRSLAALRPEVFFKLTSFTVSDFEELLNMVDPYLKSPRRLLGIEAADHRRRGRRVACDTHHRLFLAICKLRTGDAFSVQLAAFCPWRAESSLHNNFWTVMGAIEKGMGHLVQWPDEDGRAAIFGTMPGTEGCIGLVDATELRVPVPSNPVAWKDRWSAKKKCHTCVMQVVTDPYGNIIHIDGGCGGRRNDINVWRLTAIGKNVYREHGRRFFSPGQYLATDCGYGNCSRLLQPYKKGEMSASTVMGRGRRVFSNLLRRYRAVNEYIFGQIKGRFRMLGGVVTVAFHRIPLLFKAAALLVQFTLRKSPLRDPEFYDREELRVTDWEGRCFKQDAAFAPSLLRRFKAVIDPQPPVSHADQAIAHELTARIAAAGSTAAELAHSLANHDLPQ